MKAAVLSAEATSLPHVCPLEMASDERSVGGKAWNLARMLRLGVPVPRGFVVTDSSFQSYLDVNQLREPIDDICGEVDPRDLDTLKRAAGWIRALILDASIPDDVLEAVHACRHDLGDGQTLIVRSSAVGEDSTSNSFAGQLDSFRDIRSAESLENALLGCWASCWSERALHYQRSRGVRIERMGVVIQEQVQSRVAGVLFSASPDPSIEASEMVGEYCLGHGDDLVSGRINPGRFTIRRASFDYRHVAYPEQPGTEGVPDGVLDRDAIRGLHRIGLLLENEFRGAQDIEWTLDESGRIQIVQTRPVTVHKTGAVSSQSPIRDAGVPMVMWSNANINENYPDPVSPFLYSVAADGYYHYFLNLARAFGVAGSRIVAMDQPLRNTIGVHAGRLYYNLTNIHAALRMAPFGSQLVESFNIFVGASDHTGPSSRSQNTDSPNGGREPLRDAPSDRRRTAKLAAFAAQITEFIWIATKTSWQFLFLEKRVSSFERTVDEYAQHTHPAGLRQITLAELQPALRSFLDIRCHRWANASLADAASMIGYGLLKKIIGQAFSEQEHSARHNRLLQGLPDLVSAKPVIELWRLSRRIHADPALGELFARCSASEVWQRLQKDECFSAFRVELEDFLENWGVRCSGELMMTVKSFQEDPSGVLSLLKSYVSLDGESPVDMLQRQADERQAESERVYRVLRRRRALRFLPWPNLATVARIVLGWTQRAIAFRERARLKQSLLYSRCRRVVLRIGEELSERGFLRQAEDVFFLTHQELDSLISGSYMFPDTVSALVESRKAEHLRFSKMALPDSMTLPKGTYLAECEAEGTPDQSEAENSDVMCGIGACGGSVTARATVLTDVTESERLAAGDILVTRQTDPGWAPVFFLVSGLVMERGGMLSHGAIIAREYGIPTVVGVPGVTRKIRSGQIVLVDGDLGRVRLVD